VSRQHDDHLSAERLQALLDGEIPDREAVAARAHVDACPRCRAEMESWEVLFEDLSELPRLVPSAAFRERILDSLPRRAGARGRMRALAHGLLGVEGERPHAGHVGSARLQDLMDGRLAARTAARVEAHLDACAVCRLELDGFRALAGALATLPQLAPSEDFSERVMARIRIGELARAALAPTTRRERVFAWLRRAVPTTPRGWAAALGASVAPVVTLVLVVYSVFSHPLVTLGSLTSFARLKGSALAERALGGVGAGWFESPAVLQAWTFLVEAFRSPTLAAASAALLSGLTMAALWVLYRNVFASHPEDGGYARLSL
jgi:anti-sigma factor RsiW